jgi:hypothetical protein
MSDLPRFSANPRNGQHSCLRSNSVRCAALASHVRQRVGDADKIAFISPPVTPNVAKESADWSAGLAGRNIGMGGGHGIPITL